MDLLGIYNLDLAQLIPPLVIGILFLVLAKSLTLPEDYAKRALIREAMMKRRAERRDLDRMAQIREEQAMIAMLESDVDDDANDPNEFVVE